MTAKPDLLPVDDARQRIVGAVQPLPVETISLANARGRTLAKDIVARVTQPPVAVSAMDGYAVCAGDVQTVPTVLQVVGESAAGKGFDGTIESGEAVRIFTGAPVPEGADAIVIQEDTTQTGTRVTIRQTAGSGDFVRPAGLDFAAGDVGIAVGRKLTPRDIGLAAAMNIPWVSVYRRPHVAILATGDEIVLPGDPIGPGQIVSSNSWGLGAFVEAHGGIPLHLGIADDSDRALREMARGAVGADILVTTGGASVGDHDLVQKALGADGLDIDFWRIAMRPGKPLMFGHYAGMPMLGLPGNPVSSMICALLFLGPLLARLQGAQSLEQALHVPLEKGILGADLAANDRRQDYVRATLTVTEQGDWQANPFQRQDSAMMSRLAAADCLIVRPPFDPSRQAGDPVDFWRLSNSTAAF